MPNADDMQMNSSFKNTLCNLVLYISALVYVAVGVYFFEDQFTTQTGVSLVLQGVVYFASISAIVIGVLLFFKHPIILKTPIFAGFFFRILTLVVLFVFIRIFLFEPSKISSESMLPNFSKGDSILIKKYAYGYSIPFSKLRIYFGQKPNRGDLAVFTLPSTPTQYYVKRIIGLPGDHITYHNNKLVINGQTVKTQFVKYLHRDKANALQNEATLLMEHLGESQYRILESPMTLHAKNAEWQVPDNSYFLLGDNRDDSYDSRFQGYVPERNLVGEPFAFFQAPPL